jgi:hypothetical protein
MDFEDIEKEVFVIRSQIKLLEKRIRLNLRKCDKTLNSIEKLYPLKEDDDYVLRKSSSRKLHSISSDFSLLR